MSLIGTIGATPNQSVAPGDDGRRRKRRGPARPRGMFLRGNVWWCRVRNPRTGAPVQVSLCTADLGQAQRVRAALSQMSDPRRGESDLVQRVCDRQLKAAELFGHFIENSTASLREGTNDPDLAQHVDRWHRWLTTRSRKPLRGEQADDYLRQLRTLIPEGRVFRRSRLATRAVNAWLEGLPVASTSTRNRYYAALQSFVKYLRQNDVLSANPLETVERPSNAPPRDNYRPFADVRAVLAAMPDGEERWYVGLAFGSGMERSALDNLTARDVIDADSRTLRAPGTKSAARDRYVIVDAWAWQYVEKARRGKIGHAKLFQVNYWVMLDAFYAAQIAIGWTEPLPAGITPRNAGQKGVSIRGKFHTLHDCRHSYAANRLTGDDGEPSRDLQFIADQLGHADLQMVSRVYARHRNRIQQREHAKALALAAQEQTAQQAISG